MVDSIQVVRVWRPLNLLTAHCAGHRPPLTHVLLDARKCASDDGGLPRVATGPDSRVLFRHGAYAMGPALGTLPLVLDMVDLDSVKWGAWRRPGGVNLRGSIAARPACFGVRNRATRAARATLVVSSREQTALRRLDPLFAPVVLPNGVDFEAFRNTARPSAGFDVVFTGVFGYQPNEMARFG